MLLLIFSVALGAYCFYHFYWMRKDLPEGPTPFPFIGNLPWLVKYDPGYEAWRLISKVYGPVYTFWFGTLPMVIVTDYELIKESFIKDGGNYLGRPVFPMSIQMRGGQLGVIEAIGDRWQQHRRFTLHVLREFGLGKNLMEEKVIAESLSLTENLKKELKSGSVDVRNSLDAAVGSIINVLLFGYRYDETNMEEFLTFKDGLSEHFRLAASALGAIFGLYPWLGKLPILNSYFDIIDKNWWRMYGLFGRLIAEHEKTINYDTDDFSDYTEAFLKKRKQHENEPGFGGYEYMQLKSMCFDLWVAGMETTANTLYWGILYTLLDDDVKDKVRKELDAVIGSDRVITSADRSKLNYVNATINEVQRMANLLPTNLSRMSDNDVVIGGKRIPAGTIITPQISAVLYDEKAFPNPNKFNPSRFLDEAGNLVKIEEFIPFSVGKRQCLGEGLARLELFIFYANFFNQFNAKLDTSEKMPTTKKSTGVTMKAESFKVILEPRF